MPQTLAKRPRRDLFGRKAVRAAAATAVDERVEHQGQKLVAQLEHGPRGAGRDFAVQPVPSALRKECGADAARLRRAHSPSYRITGGGFGPSYAALNATDTRTELGLRLDDLTMLFDKPLTLFGRVAWAHDFVSNPALGATFQALPGASFTVDGAPIPHGSALTTLGAKLFLTPDWTLLAKFEGELAPGSQSYAGTGTLRDTWEANWLAALKKWRAIAMSARRARRRRKSRPHLIRWF